MAKGSKLIPVTIGSMANGVSQQSPAMRLRDQIEASLNARATIITGVGPRTGTTHVNKFDIAPDAPEDYANPLQITFDRGADGCYAILIVKGNLRVFNVATGQECAVSFPRGKDFVNTDPQKNICYVSAGDYMFIGRRDRRTGLLWTAESRAPDSVQEGFIFSRASNYEDVTTVKLTVKWPPTSNNGAVISTETWRIKAPGTAAGNGPLSAGNVALAIETILKTNAAPAVAAIDSTSGTWTIPQAGAQTATAMGITIERRGPLLRLTPPAGRLIEVECTDQDNAKKIYSIQRSVPKFTELPAVFWPDSIIQVSSNAEDNSPDYWVKYRELDDKGIKVAGYWVEVPAPGARLSFEATQGMPWALRATGADTFTFDRVEWDKRPIGSEETIPPPSFIGEAIQDMFFTSGRLGFIFRDGVVTSRSNDQPFNFWRESSTQVLDTDPIDILSGGAESLAFHSCALVGNEPVMFSNKSQYVLTVPSGESLSPLVADLKPSSSYQSPQSAKPLPYGSACYYVGPGSRYVSVNMFELLNTDERLGKSTNVADHVPAFISAPVKQLVGCQAENLVFALAGEKRRELYVYQFLDTEDKGRVQSAWGLWTFEADAQICGMTVLDRKLFFLIRRGTELSLEVMDVGSDQLVGPATDLVIMDRKLRETDVQIDYDATDGGCHLTLPYILPTTANSYYVVLVEENAAGGLEPVRALPLKRSTNTLAKVGADVRGKKFLIGRVPRVYVEPSEQAARNEQGDATFQDASVTLVGPILGQTAGLVMRVGSKQRRKFAKLRTVGQSLQNSPDDHDEMFSPPEHYGPGTGEYVYILRSEAEEKIPKRFYKTAGSASDILVAFENNGPLSFRIAGLIYMMAVKGAFTGQ